MLVSKRSKAAKSLFVSTSLLLTHSFPSSFFPFSQVDPAAALAKHDKDRVANEAKEREAFVGKETKLTAQEMLKAQERELEEKKKKAEKELEELAERRRFVSLLLSTPLVLIGRLTRCFRQTRITRLQTCPRPLLLLCLQTTSTTETLPQSPGLAARRSRVLATERGGSVPPGDYESGYEGEGVWVRAVRGR